MPRRIRVVRIITRLNIGGPAVHAILLTEQLDPARFESQLVAGSTSLSEGDMLPLARRKGVEPRDLPELGRELKPQDDLVALAKLYRLLRGLRPDVVHTHMAKAGTLGRIAARLARVPMVVHTYHGHVFHSYFSRPKTALFLGIERTLARLTDRIVVVGEVQRKEIAGYGIAPFDKLAVVPLGLELDDFLAVRGPTGALRAELGLAPETPLVGIVARLVPVKAHEDFLAAALTVLSSVPQARFLVIGDGERRQELEALAAKLGLGRSARFIGWRSDLPSVYSELDVVALTSLNEGSPVALIEAMAAGRAVVSTRVGGVGELIEDEVTGLTVPPRSPEDLGLAIARLLQDGALRTKLGEAARTAVYPRHSVARLCGDLASLYGEALAEKRALAAV